MTRDTGWFKSTYSGPGNGDCVEVRLSPITGIRDSKAQAAGELGLSSKSWQVFLDRLS